MRLRLSHRGAGPTAAHRSRYGPKSTPTITAAQRDAIYRQILDHLSKAGDLSLLAERNDLDAARRFAREVADELQLVLDGLGWREASGDNVDLNLTNLSLREIPAVGKVKSESDHVLAGRSSQIQEGPVPIPPKRCERAETGPALHALSVLEDAHGRSDRHHLRDLHSLSPPPCLSPAQSRQEEELILRKYRVSGIHMLQEQPMLDPA
jgi:hypothetical protein